ncbi:MAG: ATP-binding protein [Methylobacter sp.]|uniref:ATP-binding protein n=1 Tax=Methylovulum miyakonense TaxID=645578 RepID=UPI00037D85C0|nr:ATP-binding protein [Methylovulum miyakonense]PPD47859.1 MAG: ATP-binding protein [Methylobacter sp.]
MSPAILQVDVIIPTQTRYLDLIGSIGERIAKELDSYSGDREALAYHLNLVLTEATANAIKHAQDNEAKNTVRICIHIEDRQLTIKVYDHGQGFNLEAVAKPDFDHPKENGMGLFFIRTLMDSVTYTQQADGNVLEIIKYL